ncbi:MAG TPA: hypothetical protein VJH67_03355 [Candidatus Paceibacterota bacterium]
MSSESTPTNGLEGKEVLEDNARKFVLARIGSEFLERNNVTSFGLTVDWLETDEESERKVVYKKFDNGEVQILLITKITKEGSRTSDKKKITEEEYRELVDSSVLHLKKKRYEFVFTQNDIPFSLKYDEFADGKLFMLEVDAKTDEERKSFDFHDFPYALSEVTGDNRYYGYKVVEML